MKNSKRVIVTKWMEVWPIIQTDDELSVCCFWYPATGTKHMPTHLRLWDSVLPMHKLLCMQYIFSTWLTVRFITRLETAESSRLNRISNLRVSWPKKISLWVSYDSNTTSIVFSVKRESCFVVQAFVPVSHHCLSCSTAVKHFPFSNSNKWKILHVALYHSSWNCLYKQCHTDSTNVLIATCIGIITVDRDIFTGKIFCL